jgi:hypothetical protein
MAEIIDQSEIMFQEFEPLTQNRFIMYIEGIPSFLIKTVASPSFSNNVTVLDHINVQRKLKGKTTWNSVAINIYSAISPSAAQAAMEWFRLSHESVTGRDGYSDFYKKDVTVKGLGPTGDVVQEWTLKGAFIADGNFGDYDWTSDAPLEIALTLEYDYAILSF